MAIVGAWAVVVVGVDEVGSNSFFVAVFGGVVITGVLIGAGTVNWVIAWPSVLSGILFGFLFGTLAGVVTSAVAKNDTIAAVVLIVTMAGTVAGSVSGAVGVFGIGAVTANGDILRFGLILSLKNELQKSFSKFHTFLILASTSSLGLGLGWLVHRISNTGS